MGDSIAWSEIVAHELNNIAVLLVSLLQDIDHRAEQLADHYSPETLDALRADTRLARTTARKLMDAARLGSRAPSAGGGYESVDVDRLLQQVAQLVESQLPDETLELQLAGDLPSVRGIECVLLHVFLNLLLNANKAIANTKRPRITVAAFADSGADTVVVTIADNGCGIAAADLGRIFEPRFTTDPVGGSGLGLSFCHQVITAAGGHLHVDSAVNEGTKFSLHLPIW